MKKNPTKAESELRAQRMIDSAAKHIQTRIPQIWKKMEPNLTDEYWGIMGDWGDKVRERRKREYMFEELVWNEAWEETEKFDRPMQQKLMKEVDALILKFLNSPAGKHPVSKTRDYLSRPIQQNPVKPRKGEKTKAFVSRCMSEEKVKFPKQKQRIAVCLSKSQARKNPYLESGADISKRTDINRKAASMA